jgi:hypothetical protein
MNHYGDPPQFANDRPDELAATTAMRIDQIGPDACNHTRQGHVAARVPQSPQGDVLRLDADSMRRRV